MFLASRLPVAARSGAAGGRRPLRVDSGRYLILKMRLGNSNKMPWSILFGERLDFSQLSMFIASICFVMFISRARSFARSLARAGKMRCWMLGVAADAIELAWRACRLRIAAELRKRESFCSISGSRTKLSEKLLKRGRAQGAWARLNLAYMGLFRLSGIVDNLALISAKREAKRYGTHFTLL